MFCLAVTYVIQPGREEEAASHLRALARESVKEPGCKQYVGHRAKDDARTFFIYEHYVDEAAYWTHRETPHFIEHGQGGLMQLAESRTPLFCIPLEP
ncbi:MAG: antibiotic biosynthesis monooxygenase [Candidatus Eremiobacteraeota bacterium]|nr:antibiotic biosynthesis monooxygenase [Candidatus Eremiobacteraeota bacterium]